MVPLEKGKTYVRRCKLCRPLQSKKLCRLVLAKRDCDAFGSDAKRNKILARDSLIPHAIAVHWSMSHWP